MRYLHTIIAVCAAWHLSSCARTEPSLVPLGHGPSSLAERESLAAQEPKRPTPSESHAAHRESPEAASPGAASKSNDAELQDGGIVSDTKSSTPTLGGRDEPATSTDAATTVAISTGLDAWLGLYRGRDTTAFLMPEQPERRFDDKNAKIRVEAAAPNHLWFALVDSSNDKDICKLSARVEGTTAIIEAGQTCFLDPDESMTVKGRPGKAVRQDRRLVVDLVLDTSLETEAGPVHGSIEYHFDGER